MRCAPCRWRCAKGRSRWCDLAADSDQGRGPRGGIRIAAAYILGISRAIGETMIRAWVGMQPNLTFNPLEPAATITAYIVQVALGDLPHGSIGYQTIFAAGLTLMLMTLVFNLIGFYMRRRFREVY
jgi:phosphate transport system permease protein